MGAVFHRTTCPQRYASLRTAELMNYSSQQRRRQVCREDSLRPFPPFSPTTTAHGSVYRTRPHFNRVKKKHLTSLRCVEILTRAPILFFPPAQSYCNENNKKRNLSDQNMLANTAIHISAPTHRLTCCALYTSTKCNIKSHPR